MPIAPGQRLQALLRDPRFLTLPYEEQAQIRYNVAAKDASETGLLNGFSPQKKDQYLRSVALQPPTLDDPILQNAMLSLVNRAKQGDKQAINGLATLRGAWAFQDATTLPKLIYKAMAPFSSQFSTQGRDVDWAKFFTGPDYKRVKDYLDLSLDTDVQTMKVMRWAKGLGNFAGFGADLIGYYGMLAGTLKAPVGLARIARNAAVKKISSSPAFWNRAGFWLEKSAAPAVIHGVVGGGLAWGTRSLVDKIQLVLPPHLEQVPSFQEALLGIVRDAGQGAMWDVLGFAAIGSLARMGKSLKYVFFKKKGTPGFSGLTQDELTRLIDASATGETFDPALFNKLPKSAKDHLKAFQTTMNVARNVGEMNPTTKDVAAAFKKGWIATPIEDPSGIQRWTYESILDPNTQYTFKNDLQAKRFLSRQIVMPSDGFNPSTQAARQELKDAAAKNPIRQGLVEQDYLNFIPIVKQGTKAPVMKNKNAQAVAQMILDKYVSSTVPRDLTLHYPTASSGLVARGFFEEALNKLTPEDWAKLPKDLTSRDFVEATAILQDKGFLSKTALTWKPVKGQVPWWSYVSDRDLLSSYRGFEAPDALAGLWDSAVKNVPPSSLDEATRGIAEGARLDLSKEKMKIPVSQRPLITPGEADELLKTGNFQKVVFDVAPIEGVAIREGKRPVLKSEGNLVFSSDPKAGGIIGLMPKLKNPATLDEFSRGSVSDLVAKGKDGVTGEGGKGALFFSEQAKFISDRVDPFGIPTKVTRRVTEEATARSFGSTAESVMLKKIVRGTVESANDDLLVNLIRPDANGEINPLNVKKFAQLFLRKLGVEVKDNDLVIQKSPVTLMGKVESLGWTSGTGRRLRILYPWKVVNPAEEKAFVEILTHELTHIAETRGVSFKGRTPAAGKFRGSYYPQAEEIRARTAANKFVQTYTDKVMDSPAAIERMAIKTWGDRTIVQPIQGGVSVIRPDGGISNFDSWAGLLEEIRRTDLDFPTLKQVLEAQGMRVTQDKATGRIDVYEMGKGKKKDPLYSGGNPLEVANAMGTRIKLSSRLAPDLCVTAEGNIEYVQGALMGSYQDILRHLNQFMDRRSVTGQTAIPGLKGQGFFQPSNRSFVLEIPEISYTKEFSSKADLEEFMKGGIKDWENLTVIAGEKGYALSREGTGYVLYTSDNVYPARNEAELHRLLQVVPVPAYAPELTGMEVFREIAGAPLEGSFKPMDYPVSKIISQNPLDYVSQFYKGPDPYFYDMVKRGAPKELHELFRRFIDAQRALRAEGNHTAEVAFTIFHKEGGKKILHVKDRYPILTYLEASPEAKLKLAKELGPDRVRMAENIRRFLGENPQVGLFRKFGVPPEMFLTEYMPKIRKFFDSNRKTIGKFSDEGGMTRILQKAGVPSHLDAFFKHWRVEDVATFLRQKDPLALLVTYASVGHKQLILGPMVEEAKAWINSQARSSWPGFNDNLRKAVLLRFTHFVQDSLGIPTANEAAIFGALQEAGAKLGLKNPTLMKDLYNSFFTMGYLSSMGFRPWLPVRNLFQIYQTLAPRVGNTVVKEAIDLVQRDPKKYVDWMKRKGIIAGNIPVFGSEMMNAENLVAKLTHKSLAWFQNSDEFSRAVAYASAEIQFKNALRKYKLGVERGYDSAYLEKMFVETSGMGIMDVTTQNSMRADIRAGRWSHALDTYGWQLSEDTMFPYRQGMNPESFRGVVGKVFGRFGHYPVYYLQNIKDGVARGSTTQKLAFATRFVANSLVLYGIFSQVLGIQAKDFLPWAPLQFTGGPYYKLAQRVLESFGSDYRARQARGELKGEFLRLGIPGFAMINSLKRANEYSNQGDFYQMILALTSAPSNPNWSK